jgi:hypothetical protein
MSALRLRRHARGLGLSPRRHAANEAVPSYVATPVHFNGSTYLARGGALTGVSGGKVFSGSSRHFYLDDASTGTWATYIDDTIDFATSDLGLGSDAGNNEWNGDMADVWLRFGGSAIDFSLEANRRLFITAEGKPANPTGWISGGQVQLQGSLDSWPTNKGSGGGFTIAAGALGAGTGPVAL